MSLELFSCIPLGCRLTRSSCAQRHERAKRPGVKGEARFYAATCRDCETGAAHARGERPDVDVAALVRREEVEVPKPGKVYMHEGQTLTLEGWAKTPEVAALGLSAQAIRSRVEAGWTVGDALTTPKGAPRPSTSAPKKSTKPRDETPRKKPLVSPRPRKAPPEVVVRVAEAIEERAAVPAPARRRIGDAPLVAEVRETLAALSPVELLTRLGYVVEDAGLVPAGRLLLVREVAA